ncbi:MAG TPA: ABC transporter ATP-binding protein [Gemmataceae bacterium]|jgi:GNAT superfamily N-acetyltransferase|nr:ABC transporter ATP-binding protein [Gemmataceae bacterium]
MLKAHVIVDSPIVRTARVAQVEGLFDIPPAEKSQQGWDVQLPLEEKPWNIGLIVGPSGSGKSTVARALFGTQLDLQGSLPAWPNDQSILDGFPPGMPIKDVVELLSSVGFSSPPAWLRPFRVLSTGEQFRVTLARLLAYGSDIGDQKSEVGDRNAEGRRDKLPACPLEAGRQAGSLSLQDDLNSRLVVMDEYTSVVDRTVAQIGSAALARTVRRLGRKFIAVTCHEDVEDWLQPDWVYRPATNNFSWRFLQRRPTIQLSITRCRLEAWELFRRHHYLSTRLSPFAQAFLATWQGRPVAFSAWIHALVKYGGRREHRTVTLPDYQGVGIGMAVSSFCAALYSALGQRATSTTSHPAFIAARLRSKDWGMIRAPSLGNSRSKIRGLRHARSRLTAGFEYVGPPLDRRLAQRIMSG